MRWYPLLHLEERIANLIGLKGMGKMIVDWYQSNFSGRPDFAVWFQEEEEICQVTLHEECLNEGHLLTVTNRMLPVTVTCTYATPLRLPSFTSVINWINLVLLQERNRNLSFMISLSTKDYSSLSTIHKAAVQNDMWKHMDLWHDGWSQFECLESIILVDFHCFPHYGFSRDNLHPETLWTAKKKKREREKTRTYFIRSVTETVVWIGAFAARIWWC